MTRVRCPIHGVRPVYFANYILGGSPLIDFLLWRHFKEEADCVLCKKGGVEQRLQLEQGDIHPEANWTDKQKEVYEFYLSRKDKGDERAYG